MGKIVTLHWSAGNYTYCSPDYHYSITFDKKLGKAKVVQMCDSDDDILAHTWRRNTDNIGVTICSGLNMTEKTDGDCPPRLEQIELAATLVANLMSKHDIPIEDVYDHAHFAQLDGYPSERWDCRKYLKGQEKNVYELIRDKALWYYNQRHTLKPIVPVFSPHIDTEMQIINKAISLYSEKYFLNPLGTQKNSYISNVIRRESSFNPRAVSSSNAKGLMQLLPATFEECLKKLNLPEGSDPFNIDINIHCGCFYLDWIRTQIFSRIQLAEFNRQHAMVMSIAYNQGLNSVGVKYARDILSRC